jgi:hypothetical protein
MVNFTPNEKTLKILANFATINPSMLIEPHSLAVVNNAKSVIARYPFDTPYVFDTFGLYDTPDAINVIKAIQKAEIEVCDKYINIIGSNADKVKYYTTPVDLCPTVPDLTAKIAKTTFNLHFSLPADKFDTIMKMAGVLKSKYLFFETDGKAIRITVGDELESSGNNYDITIDSGITANDLAVPAKIAILDWKVLPGEYEVRVCRGITSWENLNGVTYFISTAKDVPV